MQGTEKRNKLAEVLILSGLWAINLLIVAFGFPFLVYSRIARSFSRQMKFEQAAAPDAEPKPARFLPCGNSNL